MEAGIQKTYLMKCVWEGNAGVDILVSVSGNPGAREKTGHSSCDRNLRHRGKNIVPVRMMAK